MTAKKLEKDSKYNKMDANQDGVVSDAEIDNWQQTEEVKRLNRKQMHQRNMAWVALGSMLLFTMIMFTLDWTLEYNYSQTYQIFFT